MIDASHYFWRTVLGLALGAGLVGCTGTPVFRDGRALLPVIVAPGAAPEEQAAANELGRVLGRMSGLAWPVRSAAYPGEHGFYVGSIPDSATGARQLKLAPDLLAPGPGEAGPDAFRIESRDGSVFIAAVTPEANSFAVAWLLQSQAGVRWYAPGADGEVIPRRARWSLPRLSVTRSPAYVSREIYGADTAEGTAWARHNGLRRRLEYNHALSGLFPPAGPGVYAQPDLALPEVAAQAAVAARAAFGREPSRAGFSLGINDTMRFDQGNATRALVEPMRYFRGMPDYSPLVFTFMNRAAAGIAPAGPGHYLGCLAYFWCENPPPFPVNPAIVPYVTTDRSQYYDRAYRAADFDLMSRWASSGVRAYGLWDYAYGGGFLIPRLPLHATAEAIREGSRRGARGYMADAESNWGFDAFKVWMIAQLLWNPAQSVDALAEDFFTGYYGAAAGPMRRFYDRCEEQWMGQSGPPYWLKFYQQEDQALLFPPDVCRELRALLSAAEQAAASDSAAAARVARTSRAFAVTAAYVNFDGQRRALAGLSDAEVVTMPGGESSLAGKIQALHAARLKLDAAIEDDGPAITSSSRAYFVRNDPVPRLLWLTGQRDPLAPRRILAAAGPAAENETAWRLLAESVGEGDLGSARDLALNPHFEKPGAAGLEPAFLFPHRGTLPADWTVDSMPNETGRVWLMENDATRALRIEGAWDTQVFQWQRAVPGRTYVATARVRGQSSPGNDAGLFLSFLGADGHAQGAHRMQLMPKGLTAGWRSLVLADAAPDGAVWVGVGVATSRQVAGDWLETNAIELRTGD